MSAAWLSVAVQPWLFQIASDKGEVVVSLTRWLLLSAVCAAHFVLIISLSNSGGASKNLAEKRESLRFLVVSNSAPEPGVQKKPDSASQLAEIKSVVLAPLNTTAAESVKKVLSGQANKVDQAEQISRSFWPVFNPENFLNVDELDVAALGSSELESMMTKALPAQFEFVILEFLIDKTGRIVQVACIDGECSEILNFELQALLAVPFKPALKDGQVVASRKVIHVLPVSTFGL